MQWKAYLVKQVEVWPSTNKQLIHNDWTNHIVVACYVGPELLPTNVHWKILQRQLDEKREPSGTSTLYL